MGLIIDIWGKVIARNKVEEGDGWLGRHRLTKTIAYRSRPNLYWGKLWRGLR